MVDRLKGHWKTYRDEGTVEYMKDTGVGFALRQIVPKLTIYEEISQDGDVWTVHTTSTFKNHKLVFKLGESFVDHTPDFKTMRTTFTIEGDKLVARQEKIKEKEIPAKFTREVLENGEMVMTCEAENGAVCKRFLKPYNP